MSEDSTTPADGELAPEVEVDGLETQAEDTPAPELDADGNPIPSDEDDETEELEHDGEKYALPKKLKPLLLMQADYTKKTQALAEQNKSVEELRGKLTASLSAAAGADDAIIDARAAVKAIDSQAAELKAAISAVETELANVDWGALSRIEHGEALFKQREQYLRQLRLAQDKLGEDRTKLAGDLDAKVKAKNDARTALAVEQQQATAKQFEQRDAALKEKFPKWSEEFPQIQAFVAKTFGISAEDVAKTSSPALLEVARYAKLGFEAEQRERAAAKAKTRVQPVTSGAAPVRKIVGASTPRTDPNRMSTEQWMKHRNEQLRPPGRR